MKILVKQEIYKLMKRRTTFFSATILVLYLFLMIGAARLYPEIFDANILITKSYNAYVWILFIMIISASLTITSEFQYGTIKNLLYRKYNRAQILISKWLALFLHALSLYTLSIFLSIFISKLFFPTLYLMGKRAEDPTIINQIMMNRIGNFTNLWFIISCVWLLTCIFNHVGLSVSAGIIFYLMASSISSLTLPFIEKYKWLKWNPVNMLHLSNQINTEALLSPVTQLSNLQLIMGNMIYMMLFFWLGYMFFKVKNI